MSPLIRDGVSNHRAPFEHVVCGSPALGLGIRFLWHPHQRSLITCLTKHLLYNLVSINQGRPFCTAFDRLVLWELSSSTLGMMQVPSTLAHVDQLLGIRTIVARLLPATLQCARLKVRAVAT